jgi:hypothetical protein
MRKIGLVISVSSWGILGGQLVLFDSAVKGLTAAFYSVLKLSIPLRKLSNDFVRTRRSLPWWIALGEVHHVPSREVVLRRILLGQAHCEAFSRVAPEARRCAPALRSPLGGDWRPAGLFLSSRAIFKSSSERLPSVSIPRRFSSALASATS